MSKGGINIKVMLVNREARHHAKKLLRTGAEIALPQERPPLEDTEAIQAFLEEIRPFQYVALAGAINEMLKYALATPLVETLPLLDNEADQYGFKRKDKFSKLFRASQAHLTTSIDMTKHTNAYQEAAEYPRLIGRLDPTRFIDLDLQLMAGASTAGNRLLEILKYFPAIINHVAPGADISWEDQLTVARQSTRLPWRRAAMSVDHMMALDEVLFQASKQDGSPWYEEGEPDVKDFKAVWRADKLHSIDFIDIDGILIPKGYTPRLSDPLPQDTLLENVPSRHPKTIGCPITLLGKRMEELWYWYIDGVAAIES